MNSSARVAISKRLVAINAAGGIVARVLDLGVFLWLNRYLLRRISAEEYALYPITLSVLVFLPLLSVIFSSGLERFSVQAYAQGDERRVTQIVSTMLPLHIGVSLLVLAAGGGLAWQIGNLLNIPLHRLGEARLMLILMTGASACSVALAPLQIGIHVRQRFVLGHTITLAAQAMRIALLFALLLGLGPRVIWVAVAAAASHVCHALATAAVSCAILPPLRFRLSEFRRHLIRQLLCFGGWVLVGELGTMLRKSMDPIILNKLATPLDVTCFHLGGTPIRYMDQMLHGVHRALAPQVTAMHAKGDDDRLRNTYLRLARYDLWLSLALSLPLAVFSNELIALWIGSGFSPAAFVMALMLIMSVSRYGHAATGLVAVARNRLRKLTILGGILELLNLGLTLYFVGMLKLGAAGSALGTFVAVMVIKPLLLWPVSLRLVKLTFRRWLHEAFLPGAIPGLLGAAVWVTVRVLFRPEGLVGIGAGMAAGACVYLGVLLTFCLTRSDAADLRRMVGVLRTLVRTAMGARFRSRP